MIPRAMRILLPVDPAHLGEQQAVGEDRPFASPTANLSEHSRLTDGTADMWRQLVHLCWETPT